MSVCADQPGCANPSRLTGCSEQYGAVGRESLACWDLCLVVEEGKDPVMPSESRHPVAIVTGGARGIGRSIASMFAAQGTRTVIFDINEDDLGIVAEDFRAHRWEGMCEICDVRDVPRVTGAVADVAAAYGRIDVLVNNAGVAGGGPVDGMAEEDWQHNIDVNLTGTFHVCKAVIPYMKAQKYGRIINAASYAAITPSVGGAAYAASKAGVHYFTRVLAGELGPWNITVNCYAPGMIPTELNHFADLPTERKERMLDMLSLRRWGEADDIARLVSFLASDNADYMTGALIDISGGKLATQRPELAYELYARDPRMG
jgi:3-oxoacyl-[acyl-carrier protein] reductase